MVLEIKEYIVNEGTKSEEKITKTELFSRYWCTDDTRGFENIEEELKTGKSVTIGTLGSFTVRDAFAGFKNHNKIYNPQFIDDFVPLKPKCSHNKKYLNKITTSYQFWVCPVCKESWDK